MNKPTLLLVAIFLSLATSAQTSKVFDNLTLKSEILGMERNYAIYLPPGYETSERSYPVLYLLHGATDNHTGWVQFGEIKHIADKAIKDGSATAMIVVMPDADTKQMGYTNTPNGWLYEDFFFDELMPHVEEKYRIRKEKRYRAIAGLSMGGGGTFYYALHRPDLFSSACPLSASTGPLSREDVDRQMKRRGMGDATEEQKDEWFENYSVVEMVKNKSEEDIKSVKWFIDCGDDDFLFRRELVGTYNTEKRNIPHEYRVRNGAHNWTYWRESLPVVLEFISDTFHQK